MNFEGQPEAADLKNRFEQVGAGGAGGSGGALRTLYVAAGLGGGGSERRPLSECDRLPWCAQVSLFRVHKHFIGPEAHWWRQKFKLGDNAGGVRAAVGCGGLLRLQCCARCSRLGLPTHSNLCMHPTTTPRSLPHAVRQRQECGAGGRAGRAPAGAPLLHWRPVAAVGGRGRGWAWGMGGGCGGCHTCAASRFQSPCSPHRHHQLPADPAAACRYTCPAAGGRRRATRRARGATP